MEDVIAATTVKCYADFGGIRPNGGVEVQKIEEGFRRPSLAAPSDNSVDFIFEDQVRRPFWYRWLQSIRPSLTYRVAIDVVRVVDFTSIVFTGWVAFLPYISASPGDWPRYCMVSVLGAILLVTVLQARGGYLPISARRPLRQLPSLLGAFAISAALLLAAAFLTKTTDAFARGWVLLWGIGGLLALVSVRGALAVALQRIQPTTRSGWLRRNIAIVGPEYECEQLLKRLSATDNRYFHFVGLFNDEESRDRAGPAKAGTIDDLCELARNLAIDKIFVAIPWTNEGAILNAYQKLQCLPVDIRLPLPQLNSRFQSRRVSYLNNLAFVNLADRPLGEWGCLLKLAEDRLAAVLALTLFAPVMLVIALIIKWDSPGPVQFRQPRYGFNNKLINVLKFRTMHVASCDTRASRLTARNDPRVTKIGNFLRRTSLDELPQLWNVLRGEMSMVGPRPHPVEAKAADRYYHDIVSDYAARHKVKPGITGWAQINGWRGPTETEEQLRRRVEHDLYYLNNWSLALDLKIMLMTIYRGFVDKNAF
ncbi:MAG: undecaprenyl-phosphate glucose phosphotransferase [Geminicoccaceae bacterium]